MDDQDRVILVQTAGIVSTAITANLIEKEDVAAFIAEVSAALHKTVKGENVNS